VEELRAEQKRISKNYITLDESIKKQNFEKALDIKERIKELESDLSKIENQRNKILLQIPNLPLENIPVGKSDAENIVLKEVGEKPKFDFVPKDHIDLGQIWDLIDFESAAKVTGSNFCYVKNEAVFLELALIFYAFDVLTKSGFIPIITPDLAREQFYRGTGYLPHGPEAQIYEVKDLDLGLIATAEITLAGMHGDAIFEEKSLPKKYVGLSHCFRQEAGAYGKYSKGLYRLHQFTKVEMFVYSHPNDSLKMHDELLSLEEKIWQGLGIPYRVVEMCTGDLGAQAVRKLDLEAWMPGRGDWGEVTSTSNTTDYQARRLNIRFRRSDGSLDFVHTLNGTAIAISRALIAIFENYQQKDGSILIPEVLQKYLPFNRIRE
jgi:seryl-tRNA synthetase